MVGSGDKITKTRCATGKAVADIDASAEEVTAWLFDYCSRERMRINKEQSKNSPRIIVRSNEVNTAVVATVKRFPFPLSNRDFVLHVSWHKLDEDNFVICSDSVDNDTAVDFGMVNRNIRAQSTIFYSLKKIRQGTGCTLEYYQVVDSGGLIPVVALNMLIPRLLHLVTHLRDAFQRDDAVDKENRANILLNLSGCDVGHEYQPRDEEIYDASDEQIIRSVSEAVKNTRPCKVVSSSSDNFLEIMLCVQDGVEAAPSSRYLGTNSRRASLRLGTAFTRLSQVLLTATVVIDAPIKECVAWDFSACSRQRQHSFFTNDGGASKREREISNHRRETTENFVEVTSGGALSLKRLCVDSVWLKQDNEYVIVTQKNDTINTMSSKTVFETLPHLSSIFPQTRVSDPKVGLPKVAQ